MYLSPPRDNPPSNANSKPSAPTASRQNLDSSRLNKSEALDSMRGKFDRSKEQEREREIQRQRDLER